MIVTLTVVLRVRPWSERPHTGSEWDLWADALIGRLSALIEAGLSRYGTLVDLSVRFS